MQAVHAFTTFGAFFHDLRSSAVASRACLCRWWPRDTRTSSNHRQWFLNVCQTGSSTFWGCAGEGTGGQPRCGGNGRGRAPVPCRRMARRERSGSARMLTSIAEAHEPTAKTQQRAPGQRAAPLARSSCSWFFLPNRAVCLRYRELSWELAGGDGPAVAGDVADATGVSRHAACL